MELKNEADELVPSICQFVIAQVQHRLQFDRYLARIRQIEQAQNVQQRALAAAGRADDRVNAACLNVE